MRDQVAGRFAAAAERYEQAAQVQKRAAGEFDAWLAQLGLAVPDSIAEIGCGTGLFTRLLHQRHAEAALLATDLAPAMVDRCRAGLPPSGRLRFAVCDGGNARFDPMPEWIVAAMCFQWFEPLLPVLRHHLGQCRVLAFSIVLDGSFAAWRAAHDREGLAAGLRQFPDYENLLRQCRQLGAAHLHARRISLLEQHSDGLAFARGLRAIGADLPHPTHAPVNLRRVLRQFKRGLAVNYEIGFICLER